MTSTMTLFGIASRLGSGQGSWRLFRLQDYQHLWNEHERTERMCPIFASQQGNLGAGLSGDRNLCGRRTLRFRPLRRSVDWTVGNSYSALSGSFMEALGEADELPT